MTRADLIKQAEIEEALAEYIATKHRANRGRCSKREHEIFRDVAGTASIRAAALRAMAENSS